ncbi:MAG: hypothetical protein WBG92_06470, partial [Thiohalocapsa sp.]
RPGRAETLRRTKRHRNGFPAHASAPRIETGVAVNSPKSGRLNVDRWPNTSARQAARQVFDRLDTLDPAAIGATQDNGDKLPWLRFDIEAQDGSSPSNLAHFRPQRAWLLGFQGLIVFIL